MSFTQFFPDHFVTIPILCSPVFIQVALQIKVQFLPSPFLRLSFFVHEVDVCVCSVGICSIYLLMSALQGH